MSNNNYRGGGAGQGYELDVLGIAFLVFCGLFALFYFTNGNFKYCVNSFYIFISYSFRVYSAIIILYAVNLFLLLTGLHGLYVRIFEIRVSGSKLRMYNKLEKYNDNYGGGRK